ncbi:MAG: 2-C-methyl-D-erythritol 4-phosphate cytidylyltransferase [Rhodoluna sp.]|nr:2-C-methyl-D-erythritol 4-phosphate cytidylyltransferase [Rhodoluna sp.]
MTPDLAVVLVAGGLGVRLGAGKPKALVEFSGKTILEHALVGASRARGLAQVVVAAPADYLAEVSELVAGAVGDVDFTVVAGGETRQQSIANALVYVEAPVVLVHDAARALAPASLFDRVADAVRETGVGTVPVLEVFDTIKRVEGDLVRETVDRGSLRRAQTPQGFATEALKAAYANAEADFTDDAALMQLTGATIRFVAGDALAYKITTPEDLETETRTGIGTDTHRFTDDSSKPLYLGTVVWEGERGLDGHSDGDALSHAIVDALLSAAGLGDIGSNFGVDRPEFAGANGSVFLAETLRLLAVAGWQVGNVSAQIIGNRPKVGPHRARVEEVLSNLLEAPVTISATTTDGLGFLGNTEGVAVVASAFIKKRADRLNS